MSKFNLFSRSALKSLASTAAIAAGLDPGRPGEEDDKEAGPAPGDEEQGTPPVPGADKPADPATAPEGDQAAGTDAETPVVLLADAQAHAASEFSAGRKAERDRTAAVFASDEGKANQTMAAWMLQTSPEASADTIIAQLKTMPKSASAISTPTIPDTNVNLGRGDAAAALGDGGDGADPWAVVHKTSAGTAPVVGSDAGRLTTAALAAGASLVTAGAQTPSAPAVPPTGN